MDVSQLAMRIKNVHLDVSHGTPVLTWTMEVVYRSLDIVLGSNTYSLHPKRAGQWEDVDSQMHAKARAKFEAIVEQCQPKPALDGRSFYEANLDLAHWSFMRQNGEWVVEHPVCGTFDDVTLPVDASGKPTLVGRWHAITARVLPAPLWLWAESPGAGQLRVRCVAVPEAASYKVYHNMGFIGDVADHQWATLEVPGGYYSVQVAGVSAEAQVGCLSPVAAVQVAAVQEAQTTGRGFVVEEEVEPVSFGKRVRDVFTSWRRRK